VPKHFPHIFTVKLSALLVCAVFSACGPRFDDAAELQKQGRFLKAAGEYAHFAGKNPSDPHTPDALLRSARIYSLELGLCERSRPLLERLARNYPAFKIPAPDFRRIFICPDYFPAANGSAWTYGDTQTSGRNARQELDIVSERKGVSEALYSLYAGTDLVTRQKRSYSFSDLSFYENQGGFKTNILEYPLEKGKTWRSRGAEGELEFRVEGTGLKIIVAAGEYDNCVKVRRRMQGNPAWIYEYYAPWTGKVLTAVAGPGYENRVTELLKYEEKKR